MYICITYTWLSLYRGVLYPPPTSLKTPLLIDKYNYGWANKTAAHVLSLQKDMLFIIESCIGETVQYISTLVQVQDTTPVGRKVWTVYIVGDYARLAGYGRKERHRGKLNCVDLALIKIECHHFPQDSLAETASQKAVKYGNRRLYFH